MKPLRIWLTALALAGAWLVACGAEPRLSSKANVLEKTTVPVELHGVHFSVPVLINGGEARMLIDTGADQTVLSRQAAQRLGLMGGAEPVAGSGAAGEFTASETRIAQLAVGKAQMFNLPAYIIPVPGEFQYDGVLGAPFIASFVVTLDYEHRQMTLQSRKKFAKPSGASRVPVRLEGGKLLMMAKAGGVSGWYSIDTGGGNALTFFSPAVASNGLREVLKPGLRMVTGVSPGGYTRGDLVRVPSVVIGEHTFSNVLAELSLAEQGFFANTRYVGNLGGELWRRFTVTLDYGGGQMYLAPNDAIDSVFVGPRSGFTPSIVDGAVRVVDVVAPSPASEAGIVVGDVIERLNGKSLSLAGDGASGSAMASGEVTEALSGAMRGEPGTKVTLSIRSASGTTRDAVLTLRELL